MIHSSAQCIEMDHAGRSNAESTRQGLVDGCSFAQCGCAVRLECHAAAAHFLLTMIPERSPAGTFGRAPTFNHLRARRGIDGDDDA
jgi:hypothetical protein